MSAPPGSFFAANRGGTARALSPNAGRTRSPESRLYVADPPPFGTGSERFSKFDRGGPSEGPSYHVAYRDTMQPAKKEIKGWTGIDDSIRRGRGTSTGKMFSSMAAQQGGPATGATLQPLTMTHPNEMRLQELLNLQRRKLGQMPGPGAYDMPAFQPSRTTFRRQNVYQLDGPFLPNQASSVVTTRSKEIDKMLKFQPDSGRCPGDYDSHITKDILARTTPAPSIGTATRGGRTEQAKSLSLSRSIQHGIDWHVPVIIKTKQAEEGDDAEQEVSGDKRRGRRKGKTEMSLPKPLEKPASPPGSAPQLGSPRRRYQDQSPPRDPVPEMAQPPMPPAAVARSIRRPQAKAPGDWDWNKLSHNYRSNWTTLHGGAYSLGDRTTMRRDVRQGMSQEDEEYQVEQQQQRKGADDDASGIADGFQSIDPNSLPFNDVGDTMFPIPEEQTDVYPDIGGPCSPGTMHSTGRTDMRSPGSPGYSRSYPASAGDGWDLNGTGRSLSGSALLTRQERQRRETAAAAAAFVQASSVRRSEWLAKSDMLTA